MSNLTFDERKCLHSINEDNPSEYRDLMSVVSKAYKQMSPSTLFYGFGACSVPHITETSYLFSGTGHLLNPTVMTDKLEQAYYSCLKRVEINAPIKFSSIIAKASEFASQSQQQFINSNDHSLSYFVLHIFCTGIIDDLQETISQLAQIIQKPLSIYIIEVRNPNVAEDDIDSSKLEKKCQFLFERGNRRFLRVLQFEDLFKRGAAGALQKLTENIPFEVEQYFDSVGGHTDVQIDQNQVRKNLDLLREVARQKECFLDQVESAGVERADVEKLIQEFKLYEYDLLSAEILLGRKKRVDKC